MSRSSTGEGECGRFKPEHRVHGVISGLACVILEPAALIVAVIL